MLAESQLVTKPSTAIVLRNVPEATKNVRIAVVKTTRVLLVLGAAAWCSTLCVDKFTKVQSRQGYINAMISQVRSPAAGIVHLNNLSAGKYFPKDCSIGYVSNERMADLRMAKVNLQSRLIEDRTKLELIADKISDAKGQLETFTHLLGVQKQLDLNYAQSEIAKRESELNEAKQAANFADIETQRYKMLATEGALPMQVHQKSVSETERAHCAVQARESALQSARQQLAAVTQGLDLTLNRQMSTPASRLLELTRELQDLKHQEQEYQAKIEQDENELRSANVELVRYERTDIKVSGPAVIWSVGTRDGDAVLPGTTVASFIDSSQRWVETFVAEQDASKLKLGGKAEVWLTGSDKKFPATITSIRGGVGRLTAAPLNVAVPAPDRLKKEVAVRLDLKWPVEFQKSFDAKQYFGVGRSVEVQFEQ